VSDTNTCQTPDTPLVKVSVLPSQALDLMNYTYQTNTHSHAPANKNKHMFKSKIANEHTNVQQ
jgi:hypothetical protein